tara:strand:+ start:183 stop:506 length:324 start_codon:yes stop_codon:yes gene_type:complete
MKYKKLILELGIDALKCDAKRRAATSNFHASEEGKEVYSRARRFNKKNGYRDERPTKLKNFRMYLENIEKVEELAKKLDCTYTHVLERLIVEHGDKLLNPDIKEVTL